MCHFLPVHHLEWHFGRVKRSKHNTFRSPSTTVDQLTYIHTYICEYIYIYCHPKTGLFRCITTLQCGQIRRTLEAGIETRSTLRQTQRHTAQPTSEIRQLWNYKALSSSFRLVYIYTLPDTRVLNSKSFSLCEWQP